MAKPSLSIHHSLADVAVGSDVAFCLVGLIPLLPLLIPDLVLERAFVTSAGGDRTRLFGGYDLRPLLIEVAT